MLLTLELAIMLEEVKLIDQKDDGYLNAEYVFNLALNELIEFKL